MFKNNPLVILDYKKACHKLYDTITKKMGMNKLINGNADNFQQEKDRIVVTLKDRSRIIANVLIDCSGKERFTTSQLVKKDDLYYSHVYGATFSGVKNNDENIGCFLWPYKEFGTGGGWFYPLRGGKASFGYATISNSPHPDVPQLKVNFKKALKSFRPYSEYLKDSKLEFIEMGTIPISYCEKFVYRNILISGDAAGMSTNWTCMGVEPALKYGELAGKLVVEAIKCNDYVLLESFQHIWEKENKVTYDLVSKNASKFWNSDSHFWEWIIKNDMAFLSPGQVLERMRNNDHLLKKRQILLRAFENKIRCIINKNNLDPKTIIVK